MIGPILVAGEDNGKRAELSSMLRALGYRVIEAENGLRTINLLRRRRNIALAMIDPTMSDLGGKELIANIRVAGLATPLIITSNVENEELLQISLREGAMDYLIYPISSLRLAVTLGNLSLNTTLTREVHHLRRQNENHLRFGDLHAKSDSMIRCVEDAKKAAKSSENILIIGEQGTGRETLARIIHHESTFSSGDFVRIQCSFISDPIQDEKIWNEKFLPLLNSIDGGTLCLCEIDKLELVQQKKMLEYLEKYKNRNSHNKKDFRLISLSMSSLSDLVDDKLYCKQLFAHINGHQITMPALRERREDFADIAQSVIDHIVVERGQPHVHGLAGSALALLLQYDWPGNIGEMENMLFRAILLSNGPLLTIRDFPQLTGSQFIDLQDALTTDYLETQNKDMLRLFDEKNQIRPLTDLESEIIQRAVDHYKGKMSEVARRLGIGRSTLYRKLDEYQDKQSELVSQLKKCG